MADRLALLILGLGNLLFGDDGLGAAAANRIKREFRMPAGVQVHDGGTLGMLLLPLVQEAEQLIIVDAIRADGPAGSLVRIEGDGVARAVRERLSPHQVGVADLLEAARWSGRYPAQVVLIGLVPERMEFGLERSAAIEAQLDELVDRVAGAARELGFDLRREADHEGLASCNGSDSSNADRMPH